MYLDMTSWMSFIMSRILLSPTSLSDLGGSTILGKEEIR